MDIGFLLIVLILLLDASALWNTKRSCLDKYKSQI